MSEVGDRVYGAALGLIFVDMINSLVAITPEEFFSKPQWSIEDQDHLKAILATVCQRRQRREKPNNPLYPEFFDNCRPEDLTHPLNRPQTEDRPTEAHNEQDPIEAQMKLMAETMDREGYLCNYFSHEEMDQLTMILERYQIDKDGDGEEIDMPTLDP